jgi:hypothetical protein
MTRYVARAVLAVAANKRVTCSTVERNLGVGMSVAGGAF